MRTGSTRRAVAWIGILGIVLAQFALTAHACALGASASFDPLGATIADARPAHVAMPDRASSPCGHEADLAGGANLCEVHCSDGATSGSSAADLPPVALAALPVAAAPFAALSTAESAGLARPATLPGAPPPVLRFCRLLI
jgi:hypothetical protein